MNNFLRRSLVFAERGRVPLEVTFFIFELSLAMKEIPFLSSREILQIFMETNNTGVFLSGGTIFYLEKG